MNLCWVSIDSLAAQPFMSTGFKIGEVDQDSAIVWARTTQQQYDIPSEWGGSKGVLGEVRVIYVNADEPTQQTEWFRTNPLADWTVQIPLHNLTPRSHYQIEVECRGIGNQKPTYKECGSFTTAPNANSEASVTFTVVTCQDILTVDAGDRGFLAYKGMQALNPDFFVHTGDNVYYDKRPQLEPMTPTKARYMWHEAWLFKYSRDFLKNVSSYFEKDDHDTLKDDAWPGQVYGELTFSEGLEIFREQVPLGRKTYRTFRWGKHLQIWLLEGRDFRSANTVKDGPDKTILGATQKKWLKETMQKSDATFKIVISPTPFVGPDKPNKKDNHANPGFAHEGNELREFFASLKNTYVICGDRHWQYASIDPKSGLHEFACGPISKEHTLRGGNCGYDPNLHTYFAADGGFLSATVSPNPSGAKLEIRWHNAEKIDPETGQLAVSASKIFESEY